MTFLFEIVALGIILMWSYRAIQYVSHKLLTPQGKLEALPDSHKAGHKILVSMVVFFAMLGVILSFVFFDDIQYVTRSFFGGSARVSNRDKNISNKSDVRSIKKSTLEFLKAEAIKVRLKDVAGMNEVKAEIQDVVDFLKKPFAFSRLGAKPPKGILMYGPPGTGKTLLARAIAGEAGVNFIAASGSQFEEEYVGVGAARVRELFKMARAQSPCLIFIDEIDSLASKRNKQDLSSLIQTLNQLLAEMDGLNEAENEGVIVLAATNRAHALDPAILRPGRFDRRVQVDLPTRIEREAILKVHTNKVKIRRKLDIKKLAKMTPGFSGADLANLVNEAAIYATKQNQQEIGMLSFEYAKEKVLLGAQKQSFILKDKQRKVVAYHEAGHALVGLLLKEHEQPIYKITISPRSNSLGHTSFEPNEAYGLMSKAALESEISVLLGGRVAEEMFFGESGATTGAANDFERATQIAHSMVTKWGFSKKLGPMAFQTTEGMASSKEIEKEVQAMLAKQYARVSELLAENKTKLEALARALLEHETLDAKQIKQLVS